MSYAHAGNATMPGPPYLTHMDEPAILATLAAQDAAEALIALGWLIQPHGDDMGRRRIGDLVMTNEELLEAIKPRILSKV